MRIAIIADPLDKQTAGVYTFTRKLVEMLPRMDKNNEYLFFRTDKNKGSDINQLAIPNTLKFLRDDPIRTFCTLPKAIKEFQPDVVIEPAHFGPFNLPKHIKRVTVIHDLTPILFPKWHRFHSQLLQRIILPGILKRADLVVCNSQHTMNDVSSYSPQAAKKTAFVHLGKGDHFVPQEDPAVLERYGINQAYFLFVGTIEPRKNLSRLLLAFEQFKKKNASAHKLIIVGGNGWKSKDFHSLLEVHPYRKDIILPGYIPESDLPVLYAMAAAFIYPSLYEGFGLPVLEAMACGAAVITSNVSSLPEVGGDAVLYVNPNSVADLAEKMETICNNQDLRDSLKEKSINQAAKFSWEKFSREFVNLLEDRFGDT